MKMKTTVVLCLICLMLASAPHAYAQEAKADPFIGLTPLMNVVSDLLYRSDFTTSEKLDRSVWQARQGTQWQIIDGVLSGQTSTAEYQSRRTDHKGFNPRIKLLKTPHDFTAKFSIRFIGGTETRLLPIFEFGHHNVRVKFGKSGVIVLADHEKVQLAQSDKVRLESGHWHHVLVERNKDQFIVQFADGPTLYARHPSLAAPLADTADGLGVAGTRNGQVEIDNLEVWSIDETKDASGWNEQQKILKGLASAPKAVTKKLASKQPMQTKKRPVVGASSSKPSKGQPNILLISVDDLRPELKCYGADHMVTPNIDRLASQGLKFTHAYCQQAVCLPSRISMFTGMRPDSTGVHNLTTRFRKTIPNVVTLTQHLRKSGYRTTGIGKVYHDEQPEEWDQWIESKTLPSVTEYHQESVNDDILNRTAIAKQQGLKGKKLRQFVKGPSVEAADVPDKLFEDGAITDRVIEMLKHESVQPFFLTVGYHRPHLPFVVPRKYWDLYDRSTIRIPANYSLPEGSPKLAHSTWGELRAYSDIPKQGPLSDDKALELIHGYYASISFIDAQIGQLLETLSAQGLDQNTVVMLVSDHGWKLGEHSMWCKHTNYQLDARVPLIIKMPSGTDDEDGVPGGGVCDSMVELIDLYPTLCDIAGIDIPTTCEGVSLVSLLNADSQDDIPHRGRAYSQYKRSRKTGGDIIGYSVKVPEGRYTQWTNVESKKIVATEYYDHIKDPQENVNAAKSLDPSRKKMLSLILQTQATRQHVNPESSIEQNTR